MNFRTAIAYLFILLLLPAAARAVRAETAVPASAGSTVFIIHDRGVEELPFDGFRTSCPGYGPEGVKYTTPAGRMKVAWTDVEYILPQWEEGRSLAGAAFKTTDLRPASCAGGAARRIVRKTVKVKKKEKVREEETRFPLYTIHVIAFSKEGLENGRQALAQKGARIDPGTGMEFVLVKGGCFERGDSTEDSEENEKYLQKVCVDDFSIAKYEVTQSLWSSVMNANPSGFLACGENCPVENITWYDVQEFLRLLKLRTGKSYRLPTEAEWEYAARSGGRKEMWAGTNSEAAVGDFAWISGNADGRTHPVGAKNPNNIGLYDMSGNVTEWTADRYDKDYYRDVLQRNPAGPMTGDHRVSRGGSFRYGPNKVRTGFRDHDNPSTRNTAMGLRLVLEK